MNKRLRKTEAQKRKVYVQHESLPPDLLAIKYWLVNLKTSAKATPENSRKTDVSAK